ncbi:hypothetical protein CWIS_15530 [Cellulomonas sp. A375-1]|nr:hypothetical protein CWIS_15530 [Cellulomonas sp. A375-1]
MASSMRKSLTGATLASALILGGATTAFAGTLPSFSTTGASFSSITQSFDPWPCTSACKSGKWSGWNWAGYLGDTKEDGNSVKIQSKVDGYSWSAATYWKGGANTRTYLSYKTTGGADPAQSGQLHLCRDRGSLLPDNCTNSAKAYR